MMSQTASSLAGPEAAGEAYLRDFAAADTAELLSWVADERELHWLAPGTLPPLTTEKVLAWMRPGGKALVLCRRYDRTPIAYGEVHAMRNPPRSVWLGHVIVNPRLRRRGLGRYFTTALLRYGFETMAAERAVLIVFPANTAAQACYLSLGFIEVGQECHKFPGSRVRERLVRLELTADEFARIVGPTRTPPKLLRRTPRPESARRHPAGSPPSATTRAG